MQSMTGMAIFRYADGIEGSAMAPQPCTTQRGASTSEKMVGDHGQQVGHMALV